MESFDDSTGNGLGFGDGAGWNGFPGGGEPGGGQDLLDEEGLYLGLVGAVMRIDGCGGRRVD